MYPPMYLQNRYQEESPDMEAKERRVVLVDTNQFTQHWIEGMGN